MHPLFVSFYTPDYEDCALELGRDCQRLGVDFRMACIDKFSSWMEATYAKAFFMQATLIEIDAADPVYNGFVWIDADARLRSDPAVLRSLSPGSYDVAAHRFGGRELLSGTVWFANNAKAREVVAAWCQYNSGEISCLEQRNLDHAITDTPGVRFFDLPAEYAFIFDLSRKNNPDAVPVIEHMQRSRQTRRRERRCARQSR